MRKRAKESVSKPCNMSFKFLTKVLRFLKKLIYLTFLFKKKIIFLIIIIMIIVELPGDYERTFYHRISGDGVRAYFLFPFFSLQGKKKRCMRHHKLPSCGYSQRNAMVCAILLMIDWMIFVKINVDSW